MGLIQAALANAILLAVNQRLAPRFYCRPRRCQSTVLPKWAR